MRHRKKKVQLSPKRRKDAVVLQNQAVSLILHEKIVTTKTKAALLRGAVERLITLAKQGDLNARRRLIARIQKSGAVRKLMEDLGPRYKGRQGGYLRIRKMGTRIGDGASLSQIEFV